MPNFRCFGENWFHMPDSHFFVRKLQKKSERTQINIEKSSDKAPNENSLMH